VPTKPAKTPKPATAAWSEILVNHSANECIRQTNRQDLDLYDPRGYRKTSPRGVRCFAAFPFVEFKLLR
jgi:hypothetical protein